ncbi:MAG: AbrB/MazE/SpoVT family DNA-binding domain-containing protein [Candidatus Heimdallarchaeota archaeon]
MSDEIIFERKLVFNAGSYKISIPPEIVRASKLNQGDIIAISYKNGEIVLRKKKFE